MIAPDRIVIRPAEAGEVPLSQQERQVALRDGIQSAARPAWHPAIVQNFSCMSARLHRKAVTS